MKKAIILSVTLLTVSLHCADQSPKQTSAASDNMLQKLVNKVSRATYTNWIDPDYTVLDDKETEFYKKTLESLKAKKIAEILTDQPLLTDSVRMAKRGAKAFERMLFHMVGQNPVKVQEIYEKNQAILTEYQDDVVLSFFALHDKSLRKLLNPGSSLEDSQILVSEKKPKSDIGLDEKDVQSLQMLIAKLKSKNMTLEQLVERVDSVIEPQKKDQASASSSAHEKIEAVAQRDIYPVVQEEHSVAPAPKDNSKADASAQAKSSGGKKTGANKPSNKTE